MFDNHPAGYVLGESVFLLSYVCRRYSGQGFDRPPNSLKTKTITKGICMIVSRLITTLGVADLRFLAQTKELSLSISSTPATRCAAMPSMIQRKTLSGGLMSQSSQALTTLSLSPTSPTLKDLSPNNFSVRFISYHN